MLGDRVEGDGNGEKGRSRDRRRLELLSVRGKGETHPVAESQYFTTDRSSNDVSDTLDEFDLTFEIDSLCQSVDFRMVHFEFPDDIV